MHMHTLNYYTSRAVELAGIAMNLIGWKYYRGHHSTRRLNGVALGSWKFRYYI